MRVHTSNIKAKIKPSDFVVLGLQEPAPPLRARAGVRGPGGGNVHIGRNETDQPVRVVVTFVIPVGATPTIPAPDPGTCHGF